MSTPPSVRSTAKPVATLDATPISSTWPLLWPMLLVIVVPLLGIAGYRPFSVRVWPFFIWAGLLFGFDTSVDLGE